MASTSRLKLNHDHAPDYLHAVNPKTPIEESMRALAELKA